MPSQYDMNADDELYRAVLEYDYQPTRMERNPHYDPNYDNNVRRGFPRDHTNQPWQEFVSVPDGPVETRETMIGPYHSIRPIKSYITRNRNGYYKNMRLKRIERVSAWEEVTDA